MSRRERRSERRILRVLWLIAKVLRFILSRLGEASPDMDEIEREIQECGEEIEDD